MGLLGAMLLVASANAGWVVRHILSNSADAVCFIGVDAVCISGIRRMAVWLLRARIIPSAFATPNYDGDAALAEAVSRFVCFADSASLLAALLTYGL